MVWVRVGVRVRDLNLRRRPHLSLRHGLRLCLRLGPGLRPRGQGANERLDDTDIRLAQPPYDTKLRFGAHRYTQHRVVCFRNTRPPCGWYAAECDCRLRIDSAPET